MHLTRLALPGSFDGERTVLAPSRNDDDGFFLAGGLGTGASLAIDLAASLNVRVLAYTQPIGYYIDFPNGRIDRNLTSIGLVPDGSHVRPNRTFPKPRRPAR
jgi:hypothetical protein